MPREAVASSSAPGKWWAAVPRDWRRALLLLAVVWLALGIAFRRDWAAMFDQWWNSSTYNHILLIPVILGWLVAQRAHELAQIRPQIWPAGLALCFLATLGWALGAVADVSIVQQFGVVGLAIAATITLLGPHVAAGLVFPLGYALLLVPFGDELVPPLQSITAAITVALVHASGVQAGVDGVFIHTPAGLFEVAEACSGVKFLIAMIAFGILVANICFVSWARRAVFLLICIAVPILANGVRAWGTIYAAQYFGVEVAAGFDHIVYGWVFFAIVIALVLALAWRFFDRPLHAAMIDADAINASPLLARIARLGGGQSSGGAATAALIGLAAIVLGGHAWVTSAESLSAPVPAAIALPEVPGWRRVDYAPQVWWEPHAQGADHRLLGRYRDAQGREVDVFVALYAAQGDGREAGGYGQGALRPGGDWAWISPGPAVANAKADRLMALGRTPRVALTWYRTGDLLTGSNLRLKLGNIRDRIRLRAEPTMMLILSTEEGQGAAKADADLAAFRAAIGPVDQWMDRIGGIQ